MATDYILFIHGVNTRFDREDPTYANDLFRMIEKNLGSSFKLKKVALYWGKVNQNAENELVAGFKSSKVWNQLWFKDFRQHQLLQFVGDAALYLSRHVGSQVVDTLTNQALSENGLKGYQKGDRLHLVTHSWGTVILFDILFASRWDDPNIPSHNRVQALRDSLFGLSPNPFEGIRLSSIHTMGSPISLFSLINVNGSSHDITPRLQTLLTNIHQVLQNKLPWQNFIHPGDPVAWPLASVITKLVEECSNYVDIQDLITHKADLSDFLTESVSQTILALVHGGDAHSSYWKSKEVAAKISQTIKATANPASPLI